MNDDPPRRAYEIPGEQVRSLEDFYRVIGEVINGPGGYFGTNLDALADCLRGGFGTPDDGYILRWLRSDDSRLALGYTETARQLERRLERFDPTNRARVSIDLARARRHEGPTVFDWLIDIIGDTDDVILELC